MSAKDGQDIGLPEGFFERVPRRGTADEVSDAEDRLSAAKQQLLDAKKEHEQAKAALELLQGARTLEETGAIVRRAQQRLAADLARLDRRSHLASAQFDDNIFDIKIG